MITCIGCKLFSPPGGLFVNGDEGWCGWCLRAQLAQRDADLERLKAALQESYAVVKRAFVAEGLDGAGRVYTDVQPHAQVRIKVALRAHIDAVLARSGKK